MKKCKKDGTSVTISELCLLLECSFIHGKLHRAGSQLKLIEHKSIIHNLLLYACRYI